MITGLAILALIRIRIPRAAVAREAKS
jgi:hypothetical protein